MRSENLRYVMADDGNSVFVRFPDESKYIQFSDLGTLGVECKMIEFAPRILAVWKNQLTNEIIYEFVLGGENEALSVEIMQTLLENGFRPVLPDQKSEFWMDFKIDTLGK